MLLHRNRGLNTIYFAVLGVLFSGCFWGYLLLLQIVSAPGQGYDYPSYFIYYLAALSGLFIAGWRCRQIPEVLFQSDVVGNHQVAIRNVLCISGAVLLILVARKDLAISRVFFFSLVPLAYLLFFFSHRFLPRLLQRTLFSNRHLKRALVVGSLERAERLQQWSDRILELGIDVACFFPVNQFDHALEFGSDAKMSDLERVLRLHRISHVILLDLPVPRGDLRKVVGLCSRLGVRLNIVDDAAAWFEHPIRRFNVQGVDLIGVMTEPLEDPANRVAKRLLDLTVSLAVVVCILPPLMVLVAIMQRWQSPGPLFYRQTRAGMDNQPFRIIKFRTMHHKRRDHARQATSNDRRVYRFGKFLRRTSLDELPQFLNVLRGEMSVVGPRPHMIIHNRRFSAVMDAYQVRSYIKPGITGFAQIRGFRGEARSPRDIQQRAQLDITYIERWSLWRDLSIILQTSKQILLPPRNAY